MSEFSGEHLQAAKGIVKTGHVLEELMLRRASQRCLCKLRGAGDPSEFI